VSSPSSVWIEADGGSRGNPGPSAYGAVLKDAATGETIAERGETIGVATNNVAEYRGLIAGLELYQQHTPDAALEVRMDSKLVVEQMSGNWKIKHPDMKPLALQAKALVPAGTTFTWVPRERNKHADRLANEALDGSPTEFSTGVSTGVSTSSTTDAPPLSDAEYRGWAGGGSAPTTFLLVRHGVTDHTRDKRFSGGLASSNPGLNDEGRAQVRATSEWLVPVADGIDAVVSSPVRRTRESAEIIGEVLGFEVGVEEGLAEMEFGSWDGLTYLEVRDRFPDEVRAWLGNLDHAPGGGESFRSVQERVLAGRDRLLEEYDGQTVLLVSHVTPIKTLVADALGAPLESLYRMELSPASVTVLSYYPATLEGRPAMASMRLFNARPTDVPFLSL
jgi:broad specificity phosphatase PhoE/ribonuclease HI